MVGGCLVYRLVFQIIACWFLITLVAAVLLICIRLLFAFACVLQFWLFCDLRFICGLGSGCGCCYLFALVLF